MHYIVMDLEWNQSPRGRAGKCGDMPFEIIEIGAVKLDEQLQEVGQFHEFIKPAVYRQLHYKTKEILNLDVKELEQCRGFKPVIRDFLDWCGDDYLICTWGSMDLTELQRNLSHFHQKNPFPKLAFYYDIQKLYSLLYSDGKDRCSLKTAVEQLGIPEDVPFHRAIDDTIYTVRVMQKMDLEAVKQYISVDYFLLPDKKEEELSLVFDRYAKSVSRVFSTREEAMADREITSTQCYCCGRRLRKKIRWFMIGGKNYLCLAYCPEHGYMKGKLRIKKAEHGGVFVVKTLKLINEEQAELVRQRKKEIEKKKRQK